MISTVYWRLHAMRQKTVTVLIFGLSAIAAILVLTAVLGGVVNAPRIE